MAIRFYTDRVEAPGFTEGDGPALSISAAGLAAKELREFTLPNIVVHGGFENTEGWSGVTRDTAKKRFGSYSSKLGAATGTVLCAAALGKYWLRHRLSLHALRKSGAQLIRQPIVNEQ